MRSTLWSTWEFRRMPITTNTSKVFTIILCCFYLKQIKFRRINNRDCINVIEALRAIDEAGCDILTRRRVRERGEAPGALWHIYAARDADKIRDLLNAVALERGARLEPHHDPIHDQSCYLDGPLRERLYREYGVEG